jgi:membrane carboxypeptidase/penicillin-binding protein PbpC
MTHRKKALLLAALVVIAPALSLVISALLEPLPAPLADESAPSSLEISDRHGRLLRVVRTRDGELVAQVKLDDVSKFVVPALLAAVRPKVSGSYISSALVGGTTKRPRLVARAR